MKKYILILTMLIGVAFAQQTNLPFTSKQLPAYRSSDGMMWMGVPGTYFSFYSKHKVDSLLALIKVKDLTAGSNVIIDKTNPLNWVISSTGGSSGSSNWGSIAGNIADQTDLITILTNKINISDDISILNNNVGFIAHGSSADKVRNNSELDLRYLQTETDPTVPSWVKTISEANISSWNSKLEDIIAGSGISIDKTNPLKPVISSTSTGGISALTGDVSGSGTGSVTTTITSGAVTTGKIAEKAVTLNKLQDINKGRLIGLGGMTVNPWVEITGTLKGSWSNLQSYSTNDIVWHTVSGVLGGYRALTSMAPGNDSPSNKPEFWSFVGVYRAIWDVSTSYNAGDLIMYSVDSKAYTASSANTGVAPDQAPDTTPGAPMMIELGAGISIGVDNVLRVSQNATSITGLITAGGNVSISGNGTLGSPYTINATGGGGGGGGASFLSDLGDVSFPVWPISGQVLKYDGVKWTAANEAGGTPFRLRSATNPYLNGDVSLVAGSGISFSQSGNNITITNTGGGGGGYVLPTASVSVLGGIKIGSGLSIDGNGVVSVTGGGGGGGITALTGDVIASGAGSVSSTINNGVVTNQKLANMPANTLKGRVAVSGEPEDLTSIRVRRMLNVSNNLGSSANIDLSVANKHFTSLSASKTFTFTNFDAGLELQVEITNTSSGSISISFSGGTYPNGADGLIPAGKTAVFSATKFQSNIRITKTIF